ncbi:MAG: monooxygenase [Deltaproteobacteria bacterium]|nr:monooxygenase [Deltaproteobacteria bacterium]
MRQVPVFSRSLVCATLALSLSACGGAREPESESEAAAATDSGPSPSTGPTYHADIRPLLEGRCVGCHSEKGSAPMRLDGYEDAAYWATPIRTMVTTRQMPPWTAGGDCNDYVADPTLSDEQIALVAEWVDDGAPEGDPKDARPALTVPDLPFRADRLLTMAESYTPQVTPDEYRCFLLPWPDTTAGYLRGVGLVPGNPKMVHHSVLSLVPPRLAQAFLDRDAADPGPGYTCWTGTGPQGAELIGAIEKVEAGWVFPAGVGLRVEPGSYVLMQQHYNTLATGAAEPDRSSIEVMVEPTAVDGSTHWLVNVNWPLGEMRIPAGQSGVTFRHEADATAVVGAGASLHWADLHMHVLGTRGSLTRVRADGSEECLLRVDDWKFAWQQTFRFARPIELAPGDRLALECEYDNTAANQYSPSGPAPAPRDVNWGDRSTDEMCLGNFLVTNAAP